MEQLHTFEIKDQFYLDGNPFRIISGGMHYFRVLPEYWEDRLLKLKALGCNTVESYRGTCTSRKRESLILPGKSFTG